MYLGGFDDTQVRAVVLLQPIHRQDEASDDLQRSGMGSQLIAFVE